MKHLHTFENYSINEGKFQIPHNYQDHEMLFQVMQKTKGGSERDKIANGLSVNNQSGKAETERGPLSEMIEEMKKKGLCPTEKGPYFEFMNLEASILENGIFVEKMKFYDLLVTITTMEIKPIGVYTPNTTTTLLDALKKSKEGIIIDLPTKIRRK